jgi:hypothetical protein
MIARVIVLVGLLAVAAPALAQHPGLTPPGPRPGDLPAGPPESVDLDCRACHVGEHRGIVQMYLGTGGRGVRPIPSVMSQARVECVACHTAPKEDPNRAGLLGQTFRPSERGCTGCHGAQYRGMLGRWTETLPAMHKAVAARAAAARAAVNATSHPRAAEARKLLDDADFNTRFVALGRGAHNPFYAGRLLMWANEQVDRAAALVGKERPAGDDPLVRGNYCAALCHEAGGRKLRETVTFGRTKLPHARHVTELGATCTTCHAADVHKQMKATRATCQGCHHSPQNERCETCHRDQSAFYRGRLKTALASVTPNIMAEAVSCTGCHDFAKAKPRAAIADACRGCHEATYVPILTEWTAVFPRDVKATTDAIAAAEAALAAARKAGRRPTAASAALLKEAREALRLVRAGGVAHNPLAADELLAAARRKAEQARAKVGAR